MSDLRPKVSSQVIDSSAISGGPVVKKGRTPAARNGGGAYVRVPGTKGFKSTYTTVLGAAIVEQVKKGMPFTMAAQRCRVPQGTASGWLQRGEDIAESDPDHDLAVFAADIREAQADFVSEAIDGIKDAGLSDAKQWTALMTLLERIYPEYFKRPEGKGTTVNVGVMVGGVEKRLRELHDAGELVYSGD